MKKFLYFSAVISAVFALSACQKGISFIEEPEQLVTITFTADKVAETKTEADEGPLSVSYKWTDGDQNRVKLFTVSTEIVTNPNTNEEQEKEVLTEVTNATAAIDFSTNKMSITASVAPASYTFRAVVCDPNSYTGSGTDYGTRKPKIKAEQFPNGTDNFDPSADILVSEDMDVTVDAATEGGEAATTGSMLMTFKRKVVINKMTLKNLDRGENGEPAEKVEKVVITSLTGSHGDIQGYFEDGVMKGQGKSITLKYPNGLSVPDNGEFPVYFVSMAASDIALKVDVTTDKNTYTKSFASGKSISLNLGSFTRFGFALPEGVPVTELPNGDYFITGVKDTDTYAATAYSSGNNLSNPLVITVDEDNETIENVAGIEDCVFTFTRVTNVANFNGKYTIQDANGLYLYAAGGTGNGNNYLKGEADPDDAGNAYWIVTKNSDGTYSIESAGTATRKNLRFNPTSTINGFPYPVFSCYSSGQAPITLYPVSWCHSVATPTISPAGGTFTSPQTISISCTTSDATIYYTLDGTDPDNSSSVYNSPLTISTTTTVKAIAIKDGESSGIITETYTISEEISGPVILTKDNIQMGDNTVKGTNNNKLAYRLGTSNNNGSLTFDAGYKVINITLAGFSTGTRSFTISNGTINGENTISPDAGSPSGNILDGFSTSYIGTEYTIVVTDPTQPVVLTGRRAVVWGFEADTRDPAPISWSSNTAEVSKEENIFTWTTTQPTLSNNSNLVVSYESSAANVATIASTGDVTLVGDGETIISAIYEGVSGAPYARTKVSYKLTITAQSGSVRTYTLTITTNDFNGTSYAANNNEKTSLAVAQDDPTVTIPVKWTSNQVMLQAGNMQWQKSNGKIYNSTDLGTIKNVTINKTGGSFTTYYGTTAQPTSGTTVGNGYFQIKVGGNATGTTSEVVVTFEK